MEKDIVFSEVSSLSELYGICLNSKVESCFLHSESPLVALLQTSGGPLGIFHWRMAQNGGVLLWRLSF